MPLDDAGREGELAVDVLGEAGDRRWREERTSGTGESRAAGWRRLARTRCEKSLQQATPGFAT